MRERGAVESTSPPAAVVDEAARRETRLTAAVDDGCDDPVLTTSWPGPVVTGGTGAGATRQDEESADRQISGDLGQQVPP